MIDLSSFLLGGACGVVVGIFILLGLYVYAIDTSFGAKPEDKP